MNKNYVSRASFTNTALTFEFRHSIYISCKTKVPKPILLFSLHYVEGAEHPMSLAKSGAVFRSQFPKWLIWCFSIMLR